jgi:predicted RNA-binding protein with PIN domain
MEWLVDGNNLIGSRPDGWWRDRPGARRTLVQALAALARAGEPVTVVFDGRPGRGEQEALSDGPVTVRFAPGGPDAADKVVAALARAHPTPGAVTAVTSDRALADQVRAAGVAVQGVGAFRRRLEGRG